MERLIAHSFSYLYYHQALKTQSTVPLHTPPGREYQKGTQKKRPLSAMCPLRTTKLKLTFAEPQIESMIESVTKSNKWWIVQDQMFHACRVWTI